MAPPKLVSKKQNGYNFVSHGSYLSGTSDQACPNQRIASRMVSFLENP